MPYAGCQQRLDRQARSRRQSRAVAGVRAPDASTSTTSTTTSSRSSDARRRGLIRCRWPSHGPEPRSVRDSQLAEVDEPEPLIQRRTALGAGFKVRGYALCVAAVERRTQQRRAEAVTLKACGHTQVADVVVRLPGGGWLRRSSAADSPAGAARQKRARSRSRPREAPS